MARNYKIQLFVDLKQATNILKYQEERHLKSESEAVFRILNEYFANIEMQDQAVNRLNKIIQGYNDKIQNLEFENRQLKEKEKPAEKEKEKEVKK